MTPVLPPAMVADLRAALVAKMQPIVPREHLDELVDLALHAAQEGIRATLEVLDRSTIPAVNFAAAGPAFSLLAGLAEARLDALRQFSRKHGMAGFEFEVRA